MDLVEKLKRLVDEYKDTPKCLQCHDLEWYAQSGSDPEAIRRAALARTSIWKHSRQHRSSDCFRGAQEKKHSHQRRIAKNSLRKFHQELAKLEVELKACKDFDSLHDLIEEHRVKGIRRVAIYDTALRLGAYFAHLPEKVYLHAGTTEGFKQIAKKMGDPQFKRKASRNRTLDVELLPTPIRELEAWQIEDFLCIHKGDF